MSDRKSPCGCDESKALRAEAMILRARLATAHDLLRQSYERPPEWLGGAREEAAACVCPGHHSHHGINCPVHGLSR